MLPSAISRLTLSTKVIPRPPGEKSWTICLSQASYSSSLSQETSE